MLVQVSLVLLVAKCFAAGIPAGNHAKNESLEVTSRSDFMGCFGGANNNSQVIMVHPLMETDLCLSYCLDHGMSVAATRGMVCSCNYDFTLLLPQIALDTDAEKSSGVNSECNYLCPRWTQFQNTCSGDRCCGGETAWSVYITGDIDSNLQVARRIMRNLPTQQKGEYGRTPFCYAFNIDGSHCDEIMAHMNDLQVKVVTGISSRKERTCNVEFNEDSTIHDDCSDNDTTDQARVLLSVERYKTETWYGFPNNQKFVGSPFDLINPGTSTATQTKSYTDCISIGYSSTTESSTTDEVSVSSSVSEDTSGCNTESFSTTFTEGYSVGVEGGFGGMTDLATGEISENTELAHETCRSVAQENAYATTSSQSYSESKTVSAEYQTCNDYTVTLSIPGQCLGRITFVSYQQSIRQRWSAWYAALGDAYVDFRDHDVLCDSSQDWCSRFLSQLGKPKSLKDMAISIEFAAIGTNDYSDIKSIRAEISLEYLYGGPCPGDPNFFEEVDFCDVDSSFCDEDVELVPTVPDSWNQPKCERHLRFLDEVTVDSTARMECQRDNFAPDQTTCNYVCLTQLQAQNTAIIKPYGAIVKEILIPTGAKNGQNLCDSYNTPDFHVTCPCPENYHRDQYQQCSIDSQVTNLQYTDLNWDGCTGATYTGGMQDYMRNGQGTAWCDDGRVFEGEWEDDWLLDYMPKVCVRGTTYSGTAEFYAEIVVSNGAKFKQWITFPETCINVDEWMRNPIVMALGLQDAGTGDTADIIHTLYLDVYTSHGVESNRYYYDRSDDYAYGYYCLDIDESALKENSRCEYGNSCLNGHECSFVTPYQACEICDESGCHMSQTCLSRFV